MTRTSCFLMVYVCCELEQYVILQYYWCAHILILNNTNSKRLEIKSNKDGRQVQQLQRKEQQTFLKDDENVYPRFIWWVRNDHIYRRNYLY